MSFLNGLVGAGIWQVLRHMSSVFLVCFGLLGMAFGAQALVIAGLFYIEMYFHGATVGALVLAQVWLMRILMRAPEEKAPWFNATGTLLYVIGMMVTAFALGSIDGGPAWTIS